MIPKTFFLIALAVLFCASAEAKIAGDYLESRSADVYTGQCFANGEVGLTGDEAILAWRSEEHTSELQSQSNLVCRLLLEKKKILASFQTIPRHSSVSPSSCNAA